MKSLKTLALSLITALGLLLVINSWASQDSSEMKQDKSSGVSKTELETAVFAGGCFWCVEALYQEVEGVTSAVSGFTGGKLRHPTYRGNHRGHWEAVEVKYDPSIVSYQDLLDLYWVNIDPFDNRGQFCDKGPSYKSAIFYMNDEQKKLAEASLEKVMSEFDEKVHTDILAGNRFWPVEAGHQDYYQKNPIRYRYYRAGCRRDARLEDIWGERAQH